MTSPIENTPTLAGFVEWAYAVMGIPTTAMSPTDPGWGFAFAVAKDIVPMDFACLAPGIYTLTVYNWAGSQLLQFQQDYQGQNYFTQLRAKFGISNFVAGVINSAGDLNTHESLSIGKGLQNLDLLSLQRLKDPYGRTAIAYMQQLGTLWGIT